MCVCVCVCTFMYACMLRMCVILKYKKNFGKNQNQTKQN